MKPRKGSRSKDKGWHPPAPSQVVKEEEATPSEDTVTVDLAHEEVKNIRSVGHMVEEFERQSMHDINESENTEISNHVSNKQVPKYSPKSPRRSTVAGGTSSKGRQPSRTEESLTVDTESERLESVVETETLVGNFSKKATQQSRGASSRSGRPQLKLHTSTQYSIQKVEKIDGKIQPPRVETSTQYSHHGNAIQQCQGNAIPQCCMPAGIDINQSCIPGGMESPSQTDTNTEVSYQVGWRIDQQQQQCSRRSSPNRRSSSKSPLRRNITRRTQVKMKCIELDMTKKEHQTIVEEQERKISKLEESVKELSLENDELKIDNSRLKEEAEGYLRVKSHYRRVLIEYVAYCDQLVAEKACSQHQEKDKNHSHKSADSECEEERGRQRGRSYKMETVTESNETSEGSAYYHRDRRTSSERRHEKLSPTGRQLDNFSRKTSTSPERHRRRSSSASPEVNRRRRSSVSPEVNRRRRSSSASPEVNRHRRNTHRRDTSADTADTERRSTRSSPERKTWSVSRELSFSNKEPFANAESIGASLTEVESSRHGKDTPALTESEFRSDRSRQYEPIPNAYTDTEFTTDAAVKEDDESEEETSMRTISEYESPPHNNSASVVYDTERSDVNSGTYNEVRESTRRGDSNTSYDAQSLRMDPSGLDSYTSRGQLGSIFRESKATVENTATDAEISEEIVSRSAGNSSRTRTSNDFEWDAYAPAPSTAHGGQNESTNDYDTYVPLPTMSNLLVMGDRSMREDDRSTIVSNGDRSTIVSNGDRSTIVSNNGDRSTRVSNRSTRESVRHSHRSKVGTENDYETYRDDYSQPPTISKLAMQEDRSTRSNNDNNGEQSLTVSASAETIGPSVSQRTGEGFQDDDGEQTLAGSQSEGTITIGLNTGMIQDSQDDNDDNASEEDDKYEYYEDYERNEDGDYVYYDDEGEEEEGGEDDGNDDYEYQSQLKLHSDDDDGAKDKESGK